MPQFAIDEAEKPTSSWHALSTAPGPMTLARGPGLLNLKRGRTMEPRVSPQPCMLKCCAELKDFGGSSLAEICMCPTRGMPQDHKNVDFSIDSDDQSHPEDEFDYFDLGPPPPCGPVLVRQNAMDMTASAEAKFAVAARKLETVPVTVMMPSRGTAVMMAAPRFLRHSRPSSMN